MAIHKCNICNYTTDRHCNYTKHIESNKHKEAVELHKELLDAAAKTEFTCNYCDEVFTHKSSVSRHRKMCSQKSDLTTKVLLLEKENSMLRDQLKETRQDKDSFKNIAETTVETAKISTSALSFAIKNYKTAPAIQTFSNFKLLLGNETKYNLAEIAIHYHARKELPQYIGNILIKEYKKDNPNDQSMYNTDTTRSSYIIRELVDEESEWLTDKGAIKTSKYTIKPILDYLKIHLDNYFEDSKSSIATDTSNKIFNNMIMAQDIINNIKAGTLNKDIIKYISSYFHIDKKIVKQIELDGIIGD